jgi:hypothetical protein
MAKKKSIGQKKTSGAKKFVKSLGGVKKTRRRGTATKRLLSAFGLTKSQASGGGPGRPTGTYKYGMPIHEFKKLQARKKALYQSYKQEQNMRLKKRGLTPEQIQQLQYQRTATQPGLDIQESVPDEELAFREFLAKRTISPQTQRILDNLRRTQLKAKSDDVEMQRRIREKKMVAQAGSLLATPFVFKDHQMNITGIPKDNILLAPNIMREREDNPHILQTNKLNILQTTEAGNTLKLL